jgi:transposase
MKGRTISNYNLKKILLHFCIDIEASKTSILTGINRNTINAYYSQFRKLIAAYQADLIGQLPASHPLDKEIEAFLERIGPITTLPVRKQVGVHQVYGLIVHKERIYSELAFAKTGPEKNTDYSGGYNAETLIGKGFKEEHQAILFGLSPQLLVFNKTKSGLSEKKGNQFIIESFWSFSRRRLNKFNGVNKHFYYHLKECEWRWKKKEEELLKELTALLGR